MQTVSVFLHHPGVIRSLIVLTHWTRKAVVRLACVKALAIRTSEGVCVFACHLTCETLVSLSSLCFQIAQTAWNTTDWVLAPATAIGF